MAISTLYEHPQYLESFIVEHDGIVRKPVRDGMKTSAVQTGQPRALPTSIDEHRAYALKCYNKAIQALRTKVEAGKASPALVMLSSVLFMCIELIQDDLFAVSALLARASALLRDFEHMDMRCEERQLFVNVKHLFKRLGVLASAFGSPHLDGMSDLVDWGTDKGFDTISGARTALFSIMANSSGFIRDAAVYKAFLFGEAGDSTRNAAFGQFSTVADPETWEEESAQRDSHQMTSTVTFISAKSGDAAKFYSESFLTATDRLPDFSGKDPERVRAMMEHEDLTGYVLVPDDESRYTSNDVVHNLTDETWDQHVRGEDVKLFADLQPNFARPKELRALLKTQRGLQSRLKSWYDGFQRLPRPTSPSQSAEKPDEATSGLLMYAYGA